MGYILFKQKYDNFLPNLYMEKNNFQSNQRFLINL